MQTPTSDGHRANTKVREDLVDQAMRFVLAADLGLRMTVGGQRLLRPYKVRHLSQIYDRNALWSKAYARGPAATV
jgi:hypothetical protein